MPNSRQTTDNTYAWTLVQFVLDEGVLFVGMLGSVFLCSLYFAAVFDRTSAISFSTCAFFAGSSCGFVFNN